MPIIAGDIQKHLSGGTGNSDPNASLGGVISTTEVVDDTVANLFALAPASEAEAGSVKYRAIFIKNTHGSLTLINPKVYISSNTTSGATSIKIALADEDGSPIEVIADEDTAPDGPSFSTAAGFSNGLSLGNLAPGEVKAIWIEYTIDAGASAVDADESTIQVKGDTEA